MREEYMLIHFTNKILSRCNHFNDFEEARKRFIDICQLFISNCDKIADIEYDIIKEDNVIGFDIHLNQNFLEHLNLINKDV